MLESPNYLWMQSDVKPNLKKNQFDPENPRRYTPSRIRRRSLEQ